MDQTSSRLNLSAGKLKPDAAFATEQERLDAYVRLMFLPKGENAIFPVPRISNTTGYQDFAIEDGQTSITIPFSGFNGLSSSRGIRFEITHADDPSANVSIGVVRYGEGSAVVNINNPDGETGIVVSALWPIFEVTF